ncbi:MAG: hypothetical protein GVY06_03450 [Alphaproteobacteria bacterium]|jgi:hypothetical protein|nr:hypothetical protein [Alphaproteobacteria bacterium]
MTDEDRIERVELSEREIAARKRRNLWLALALFGFVILVGAVTMVRLSQTGMGPDQEFYWHIDN